MHSFRLNTIIDFLTAPVVKHFPAYVTLLLLQCAGAYWYVIHDFTSYAIYLLLAAVLVAYVTVLIYELLRPCILRKVYVGVCVVCFVLSFIGDLFCVTMDYVFNQNFVAIIYGTNAREVAEFFEAYCHLHDVLCYLACGIGVAIIYVLMKRFTPPPIFVKKPYIQMVAYSWADGVPCRERS